MNDAVAKTGNSTSIEDSISKRSVQEIDRRIGVSSDDRRTKALRKAIKLVPDCRVFCVKGTRTAAKLTGFHRFMCD